MDLPQLDQRYLADKEIPWELKDTPPEGACLIFKGYAVRANAYDRDTVDVMVRLPAGYPMAKLDMFYVDPPLRLRSTNAYPVKADVFEEDHGGRKWQRFSRHFEWKVGVDDIRTMLGVIAAELRVAGHTDPEESGATRERRVSAAPGPRWVSRPPCPSGACRA